MRHCPVAPIRRRLEANDHWNLPQSHCLSHRSQTQPIAKSLLFVLESTSSNIFPAFQTVSSGCSSPPFAHSHTHPPPTSTTFYSVNDSNVNHHLLWDKNRGSERLDTGTPNRTGSSISSQVPFSSTCSPWNNSPGASWGEGGVGSDKVRVAFPKPDSSFLTTKLQGIGSFSCKLYFRQKDSWKNYQGWRHNMWHC